MKYQQVEAKRIGLNRALETAGNARIQADARRIRGENKRRTRLSAWLNPS